MKDTMVNISTAGRRKRRMSQGGFTLLDLSIWLIVIGLFGSAALGQYNLWAKKNRESLTRVPLQSIDSALENYYFMYGAYPCPAVMTLASTSPLYGVANCAGTDPIISGSVPFKDLMLPPNYAIDGWKNRLMYTVTRSMTNPATFDSAPGQFNITTTETFVPDYDELARPLTTGVLRFISSGHYVVLSFGENSRAARTVDGVVRGACPNPATSPREAENCDNDRDFWDSQYARSSADAANEILDDRLIYRNATPSRMWSGPIGRNDVINEGLTIGIGTDNPDPNFKLDVTGNVLVEGGVIRAAQYCDPALDDSCFSPELIAGAGVNCGTRASPGMNGLAYGDAVCTRITAIHGHCATDQYITGIRADGSVICAP